MTIVILLTFYLSIYLVGTHYFSSKAIKDQLTNQLTAMLQRTVQMSNKIDFEVTWTLTPHVVLHDVTVANVVDSIYPIMLNVEKVEISFDLVNLLFKKFHIYSVSAIKPILYLENINQVINWNFPFLTGKTSTEVKVDIDKIFVIDGNIKYYLNSKLKQDLKIKHLTADIDDSFTQYRAESSGALNNLNYNFFGEATINQDSVSIEINKFSFGNIHLTGNLDLKNQAKTVKGKLIASSFSLNDAMSIENDQNPSGEYSLPNKDFPLDFLRGSEVDISIKIKEFLINKLVVEDVNLAIATTKNVLAISLKPKVNVAGGDLNLDINYDLNPNIPAVKINVNSANIQLEKLLSMLLNKSPISGSALNLSANLTGQGTNLNSIVASLKGKILITASAGVYLNASAGDSNLFSNLLTAMITFQKSESTTDFSCAVMNFNVRNGIANATNGLALEATTVKVMGGGQVDLRNGKINFAINPQTSGIKSINISQFSVAQAITISGTITKPQININPISALASIPVVDGVATVLGGVPLGVASITKNLLDPSKSDIHPCSTALRQ